MKHFGATGVFCGELLQNQVLSNGEHQYEIANYFTALATSLPSFLFTFEEMLFQSVDICVGSQRKRKETFYLKVLDPLHRGL